MNSLYDKKTISISDLFDSQYIDGKMLFMHLYNSIPDTACISGLDGEKAAAAPHASSASLTVASRGGKI